GPQAKRAFEAGVSGLVGQIRTTQGATRVVADVWGLGSDLRWAVTPCFGFQGEVYAGQTLGAYTGGILQNVNALTFQVLHAAAGWVEVALLVVESHLPVPPLDRFQAVGHEHREALAARFVGLAEQEIGLVHSVDGAILR